MGTQNLNFLGVITHILGGAKPSFFMGFWGPRVVSPLSKAIFPFQMAEFHGLAMGGGPSWPLKLNWEPILQVKMYMQSMYSVYAVWASFNQISPRFSVAVLVLWVVPMVYIHTHRKLTCPLKKGPFQKENSLPTGIFQGDMLVSGL